VPIVVAKGDDAVAAMIVEEARRQGVYVSEDPQLLALLSRLNVDDEIPAELYTTVAVILSWVYWLKGMRPGDEKKPEYAKGEKEEGAEFSAEKSAEKTAEKTPEQTEANSDQTI
jgi:flagellar biosynthesis protein